MEVTIVLENATIRMKSDGRMLMAGSATQREAVAVSLIHAVVSAVADDRFPLDRLFTVKEFEEHAAINERMCFCKWTKNGYLKRISEADEQFKHCNTAAEALSRTGAFTCMARLYAKIPKSRPSNRKPDTRDRTTTPRPMSPVGAGDNNRAAPGASV